MEHELSKVDRAIIEHIDRARAANHSVTARQLGAELKLHNSYISRRLHALRELGLVDFNEKVPGAIWVAGTIEVRMDSDGNLVPLTAHHITDPDGTRPSSVGSTRPIRLGVHTEKLEATSEVERAQAIKDRRLEALAKARAAKAAKKAASS